MFRAPTIAASGEAVALGKFGASQMAGRNKLASPRHRADALDTDEGSAEKSAPTSRNGCAEKQRSFLGPVMFAQVVGANALKISPRSTRLQRLLGNQSARKLGVNRFQIGRRLAGFLCVLAATAPRIDDESVAKPILRHFIDWLPFEDPLLPVLADALRLIAYCLPRPRLAQVPVETTYF
jgi:hypothetical protein